MAARLHTDACFLLGHLLPPPPSTCSGVEAWVAGDRETEQLKQTHKGAAKNDALVVPGGGITLRLEGEIKEGEDGGSGAINDGNMRIVRHRN